MAAAASEEARLRLRREAGRQSCLKYGVGPTGGFCLSRARLKVGGNFYLPHKMGALLGALFANQSVLDLGCGLGQYGKFFADRFPSVRWLGIDGAERVEELTNGHVRFADLTEGLPLFAQQRWDWVMSLEVAEHVPRSGEAVFVHNLLRYAEKGVILSWAPPPERNRKDNGHHHVSCQTNEYVTCALGLLGMSPDYELQERLRTALIQSRECPWLIPSVMSFRPSAASRPVQLKMPRTATPRFVSRYLNFTRERCPSYLENGCQTRLKFNEQSI